MTEHALAKVDPAPVDNDQETGAFELPDVKPEGIHFGMPEDDYHSDISLGSGSVRTLAKCPIYYWRDSWLNPFREPTPETPALLYGRALHCLVLEGVDEFHKRFKRTPILDDVPDALRTMPEIKARLKELGGAVSGNKDEITQRLKDMDPQAVFWDEVLAEFEAMCARDRVTALKPDKYAEIIQAAQYITNEPRVRQTFQNGVPEISLFWEIDGVPMKARLDYTRLGGTAKKPVGIITDLKSFANVLEQPPERAVANAITKTRLDVQMAAYFDGIQRIPQWIAEGKVYGAENIEPAWLDTLGAVREWHWFWVFYEKGLPVSLLRSVRPGSQIHETGKLTLSRALQAYRDNMEAFGMNWRFVDPIADPVIDIDDLPGWHARDEG